MSCLLRPWDQNGFDATTDPGPPFTEVLTVITLCFTVLNFTNALEEIARRPAWILNLHLHLEFQS